MNICGWYYFLTKIVRIIKYFKFIKMRVPEKLGGDSGFISVDDGIIVATPHLEAIGVAWWYMPDNVHLLTTKLGRLEFID